MKTIESKIAPNPKEAQIWVDLSADPHGLVRKYWNGSKWVEKNKSDDNTKIKQYVDNVIIQLTQKFDNICNGYDKTIAKLHNDIDLLAKQIDELEQLITIG